MAWQKYPSKRWKEILDITDEVEQGKVATEYVMWLESEVKRLNSRKYETDQKIKYDLIDNIMKCKPFSEWLNLHDNKIKDDEYHFYNDDYSGLQGGL